jgi:hypothetical protein
VAQCRRKTEVQCADVDSDRVLQRGHEHRFYDTTWGRQPEVSQNGGPALLVGQPSAYR